MSGGDVCVFTSCDVSVACGSPGLNGLHSRSPVVFRWTFGRSTNDDRQRVRRMVFCPQALVHMHFKARHWTSLYYGWTWTEVARCHSPVRRCDAVAAHRGSTRQWRAKASCGIRFQWSMSVILTNDSSGRPPHSARGLHKSVHRQTGVKPCRQDFSLGRARSWKPARMVPHSSSKRVLLV